MGNRRTVDRETTVSHSRSALGAAGVATIPARPQSSGTRRSRKLRRRFARLSCSAHYITRRPRTIGGGPASSMRQMPAVEHRDQTVPSSQGRSLRRRAPCSPFAGRKPLSKTPRNTVVRSQTDDVAHREPTRSAPLGHRPVMDEIANWKGLAVSGGAEPRRRARGVPRPSLCSSARRILAAGCAEARLQLPAFDPPVRRAPGDVAFDCDLQSLMRPITWGLLRPAHQSPARRLGPAAQLGIPSLTIDADGFAVTPPSCQPPGQLTATTTPPSRALLRVRDCASRPLLPLVLTAVAPICNPAVRADTWNGLESGVTR
jgi:hypothetical protein